MKIKNIIAVIVSILFIVPIAFGIKPILNYTSNAFWNFVANQLDKEEAERMKKIENGEIIRGKDTILIWNNKYEISHYTDGNHLSIKNSNETFDNIIEKIQKHKIIEGKLYIVSEEGFAVINEDNLCRVLITVPDEKFVNGYNIDEDGNKQYISRRIKNNYVKYLLSINEFTREEQKILQQLR